MKQLQIGLVALLSLLTPWPIAPARGQAPPVPPCGDVSAAALPDFVNAQGLKDFINPPEPAARPISPRRRGSIWSSTMPTSTCSVVPPD